MDLSSFFGNQWTTNAQWEHRLLNLRRHPLVFMTYHLCQAGKNALESHRNFAVTRRAGGKEKSDFIQMQMGFPHRRSPCVGA